MQMKLRIVGSAIAILIALSLHGDVSATKRGPVKPPIVTISKTFAKQVATNYRLLQRVILKRGQGRLYTQISDGTARTLILNAVLKGFFTGKWINPYASAAIAPVYFAPLISKAGWNKGDPSAPKRTVIGATMRGVTHFALGQELVLEGVAVGTTNGARLAGNVGRTILGKQTKKMRTLEGELLKDLEQLK